MTLPSSAAAPSWIRAIWRQILNPLSDQRWVSHQTQLDLRFAGFLWCYSRTVMKSFLKKISYEFSGSFMRSSRLARSRSTWNLVVFIFNNWVEFLGTMYVDQLQIWEHGHIAWSDLQWSALIFFWKSSIFIVKNEIELRTFMS